MMEVKWTDISALGLGRDGMNRPSTKSKLEHLSSFSVTLTTASCRIGGFLTWLIDYVNKVTARHLLLKISDNSLSLGMKY